MVYIWRIHSQHAALAAAAAAFSHAHMTPTRALLTVAVVVTLTAGAVVVGSASRVGKENYNVGSDPPPPPQVSAACSQHHRTASLMCTWAHSLVAEHKHSASDSVHRL